MVTAYSTYRLGAVASVNFLAIENMTPHFSAHVYYGETLTVHYLGFVVCVWTTHEEYLVLFIIVQNMVGIDALVLIICTF